ncbi:MAG: alpha/beta hydrolase [Alphaproteobacteria bacterium]|nr:alpha/beta hydrolase [Alphaproteobacteria bacterium]
MLNFYKFITPACLILSLIGCSSVNIPVSYHYRIVQTRDFELASWQKLTDANAPVKFYIEGDGHAFNAHGQPSLDPTPRGTLVRELAFGDSSPNVVYLARPCQYIKSGICSQRHWTTARFAPEVLNAEYQAVNEIAGGREVILIGFSGGAQIAGLAAAAKPGLHIKKIVTIGGNLDHLAWTQYHHLPPLTESLNLESYRRQFAAFPQIHYAGSDDKVMPPALIKEFVGDTAPVIVVDGAAHDRGYEKVYQEIWNIK